MTYPSTVWYGNYPQQAGFGLDGYSPRTMFCEGPIRVRDLEGSTTAFWDSPTDRTCPQSRGQSLIKSLQKLTLQRSPSSRARSSASYRRRCSGDA